MGKRGATLDVDFRALRSHETGPLQHSLAFLARRCQPAYRRVGVLLAFLHLQATGFSRWRLTFALDGGLAPKWLGNVNCPVHEAVTSIDSHNGGFIADDDPQTVICSPAMVELYFGIESDV